MEQDNADQSANPPAESSAERLREALQRVGRRRFSQIHLVSKARDPQTLAEFKRMLAEAFQEDSLAYAALYAAARDGLLHDLDGVDASAMSPQRVNDLIERLLESPAQRTARASAQWATATWLQALADQPERLGWLEKVRVASGSWRAAEIPQLADDSGSDEDAGASQEVVKLRHFSARFIRVDGRNRSLRTVSKSQTALFDLAELGEFDSARAQAVVDACLQGKSIELMNRGDAVFMESESSGKSKREKLDPSSHYAKLNTNVGKLSAAAHEVEDETGSSQLYLGYPWLSGVCSDPSRTFLQAPVLLHPVKLKRITGKQGRSRRIGWELQPDERRDTIFNETLARGFYQFEGANITEADQNALAELKDPQELSATLAALFEELKLGYQREDGAIAFVPEYRRDEIPTEPVSAFTLHSWAGVGLFPQTSSAIRKDYDDMLATARRDPALLPETIKALLDAQQEAAAEEEDSLDDALEGGQSEASDSATDADAASDPEAQAAATEAQASLSGVGSFSEITPVLPIDSSQEAVIARSSKDARLVVHGPPGTGKSQVISNIVAQALARGERVVVCCQKRAALDVVYERLSGLGLSHHLALVHHYKNDRKAFLAHLRGALDAAPPEGERNALAERRDAAHQRLAQLENDAQRLHQALTQPRTCGFSANQLYAELPRSQFNLAELDSLLEGVAASSNKGDWHEHLERFKRLGELAFRVGQSDHPWHLRRSFAAGAPEEYRVTQVLSRLSGALDSRINALAAWQQHAPGVELPASHELAQLADLLEMLATQNLPAQDEPAYALVREGVAWKLRDNALPTLDAYRALAQSLTDASQLCARLQRGGAPQSAAATGVIKDLAESAGATERQSLLARLAQAMQSGYASAQRTRMLDSQTLNPDQPLQALEEWLAQPMLARSLSELRTHAQDLAGGEQRGSATAWVKEHYKGEKGSALADALRRDAALLERIDQERPSFWQPWQLFSASWKSLQEEVGALCQRRAIPFSPPALKDAQVKMRSALRWAAVDESCEGMKHQQAVESVSKGQDLLALVEALDSIKQALGQLTEQLSGRPVEPWLARWMSSQARLLTDAKSVEDVQRMARALSEAAAALKEIGERFGRVSEAFPSPFRQAIRASEQPALAQALIDAGASLPEQMAALTQHAPKLAASLRERTETETLKLIGLLLQPSASDLNPTEARELTQALTDLAGCVKSAANAFSNAGRALSESLTACLDAACNAVPQDAESSHASNLGEGVKQVQAWLASAEACAGGLSSGSKLQALLLPAGAESTLDLHQLKSSAGVLAALSQATQRSRTGINELAPWLQDSVLEELRALLSKSTERVKSRVDALQQSSHQLSELAEYDAIRASLADDWSALFQHFFNSIILQSEQGSGASAGAHKLDSAEACGERFAQQLREEMLLAWIRREERATPALKSIQPATLESQREHMSGLVEEIRALNLSVLRHDLDRAARRGKDALEGVLRPHFERSRGGASIRQILEECEGTPAASLFDLLPCWLVSPETLSAIFPLKEGLFDLIIFDEASQCTVEEALPALYRARRCVIAGDDKQLQPGDAFRAKQSTEDLDENDPALHARSILGLAKRCFDDVTLRWHYRSRFEELIAFSNAAFYEGKLLTVPSRERSEQHAALRWHYVEGGEWKKTKNIKEAHEVVEVLFAAVKQSPESSFGIITFNQEQQELLIKLIDDRCSENEEFAELIAPILPGSKADADQSLFIRNIENVQGDERDVVIFSVGYGPDADGKVRASFGSLNRAGGENRLNVAITRARQRIIVVSSVEPHQLQVSGTRNDGPKLLRAYLEFVQASSAGKHEAAAAVLDRVSALRQRNFAASKAQHSPFLAALESAINHDGDESTWLVGREIGASTFRLDLAAALANQPDAFRLALESDGHHYAATPHVREREVYRPALLAAKGWQRHRVWARAWWESEGSERERLWAALDRAGRIED